MRQLSQQGPGPSPDSSAIRPRRVRRHIVKLLEVLAGQCHQLTIGGVVTGDGVDDGIGQFGRVGGAPVAKLVACHGRTCEQDFAAASQCGGDVSKEGAVVARFALVFVVAAGLDALCLDMLLVEHHHMGFGVVHPDNGVKCAHKNRFQEK